MATNINIFWKVIFVLVLIILSLIPSHFIQQYIISLINEQSTITHFVSETANYVSGVVESIQNVSMTSESLNLKTNYLLNENNLKISPLTLGLAFLLLLVLDITQSLKLSLINYFIIGIGLVLFFLAVVIFSHYMQFGFAYFTATIIFSVLFFIYLSGVMKSIISGIIYAIGLFIIYTFAFYFIGYVDDILIYGAICLIIFYVVILLMTRKIDWNEPVERTKGRAKKLN